MVINVREISRPDRGAIPRGSTKLSACIDASVGPIRIDGCVKTLLLPAWASSTAHFHKCKR